MEWGCYPASVVSSKFFPAEAVWSSATVPGLTTWSLHNDGTVALSSAGTEYRNYSGNPHSQLIISLLGVAASYISLVGPEDSYDRLFLAVPSSVENNLRPH